jgi:16S rRNA (adenine1518-N6/adenine1519-N6)-dimethyltransferase
LTRILAGEAGRVVAVELDERLISVLHLELGELGNVELVHGDFLKCDVGGLVGEQYAVVSNLPYYITGAIIRRLLHRPPRPWRMVLTVQEEVAQRMLAKPGDMNLLAVSVQYFGRVFRVARVKAGSFYPRPDVDSAVVRFDLRDVPAAHVPDEALFFRVVTAGFRQKRKQLRNSLQAGLDLEASDVEALLLSVGIDPRRRAETLSLEDWGQVTWAVATSNPGRWMSAVTSD